MITVSECEDSGESQGSPRRAESGERSSGDAAAVAAARRPLENIANNSSPEDRRDDRYGLLSVLWKVSTLQRLRYCRRVPRDATQAVALRLRDAQAGYAGLQTCGSVWSCPIDSAKVLHHRALEIGAVLGQAITEGHVLAFATFTMRHRDGQALAQLFPATSKAWARATSGKYWLMERASAGVVGFVRVWEVTIGRNGWHVHVHAVFVLQPGTSADALDRLCMGMFARWSRQLVRMGYDRPLLRGQEWHMVSGPEAVIDVAGYLCKVADQGEALGMELAYTQPGRGRSALKTQPVWSLLREFAATGDADVLDRWHEWEQASKGRRQVAFSRGLRERFAPALPELSDDQVADLEHGSADDDLVHFDLDGWRQVVASGLPALLLREAENGGLPAVRSLLDSEGVPYLVVRMEAL